VSIKIETKQCERCYAETSNLMSAD
jgi:hypothetical protein